MPDPSTPPVNQSYAPPIKKGAPAKTGTARTYKMPQAAWNSMIVFSFAVNIILVVVLLVLGVLLFDIKNSIAQPLIGGLHSNFVKMDESHIVTNITVDDTIIVNDTIPVVFDLPLNTATVVTLTEAIAIPNTMVVLNGIAIPTDIILPAGTPLKINLNIVVPVSQTIPVVLNVPVHLNVPVDIALNQTDLHAPFTNLASLVGPYNKGLEGLPNSWKALFFGK